MAERISWAVGTTGIPAEDARIATSAMWTPSTAVKAKTGFRPGPGTSPGTVSASGTPDANVSVSAFTAVIQTTRASVGGAYIATLDTAKTINILSTPANATNPRNDLIIAHQSDQYYGDGSSALLVRQVVGTPSGSPSDPSTASYPDAIILARVRVNANATTITSGNITDLRPASLYTVAVGGILPVATQAVRDALTGYYSGFPIWRSDREWVEIHDGTAWRVQGMPIVTSASDLSAITHPQTGQIAWNTADDSHYRYSGSWRRADWARPWGLVGGKTWANTAANLAAGLSTTELTLNMDSGSVTTLTGRRYRLWAVQVVSVTTTGANVLVLARDNGTAGVERGRWFSPGMLSGIDHPYTVALAEWSETADGARTYYLTGRVWTGGGTATWRRATVNNVSAVWVEDLGATTALTTVA